MSFNVSISDEARVIALKYGKNVSQGIIAMEALILKTSQEVATHKYGDLVDKETVVLLNKRLDKLELGIQETYANAMQFISSGQGAVRVYEKELGFVKASELNSAGDL